MDFSSYYILYRSNSKLYYKWTMNIYENDKFNICGHIVIANFKGLANLSIFSLELGLTLKNILFKLES